MMALRGRCSSRLATATTLAMGASARRSETWPRAISHQRRADPTPRNCGAAPSRASDREQVAIHRSVCGVGSDHLRAGGGPRPPARSARQAVLEVDARPEKPRDLGHHVRGGIEMLRDALERHQAEQHERQIGYRTDPVLAREREQVLDHGADFDPVSYTHLTLPTSD